MPRDVGVLLLAAGRGTRMGGTGEQPKQFRPLGGVPMLLRALRPFAAHPEVVHVSVVLPPEDAASPPRWLAEVAGPLVSLVAGGVQRTDSARAGLAQLPAACRVILVHDAARPLVDRATIDRVLAVARLGTGAVPALPVGDTLKAAEPGGAGAGRITGTVSRAGLWRAQTPQGFPRPVLEAAYARALESGTSATDDAALVEALGEPVLLVPGSERNLKITTAEDFAMAELLAAASP